MQLREPAVKAILADAGIAVPNGRVCTSASEVRSAAADLTAPFAVKSLVRTWGRGKAGLVRRCADADAGVAAFADLTTAVPEEACLVEEWQGGARELYLAEIVDPELGGKAILFAPSGGVDLESMRGVHRVLVPAATGVTSFHARRVLRTFGQPAELRDTLTRLLRGLDSVFTANDGRLLEINPLSWSDTDGYTALDAKLVVDDNAVARHAELVEAHHRDQHAERSDTLRLDHGLEYVELAGDVGLISGGAGMTLATMDLIAARGGAARSFLDCSQNVTTAGYGAALGTLHSDPSTTAILVNIVGGGTEVDGVASILVDLLDTYRREAAAKPVVVRLEGTNSAQAREILTEHGVAWQDSLEDAVDAAVAAARRS